MSSNGESSVGFGIGLESLLSGLKKRGEYRKFAVLRRMASAPSLAECFGHSALSADVELGPDGFCEPGADEFTVWCSNDYLGMSRHPVVLAAAKAALESCGVGAGGTRNIAGTNVFQVLLEKELAGLHQKEAALIFTSGYNANEATLSVLGRYLPKCTIFSDELNHASMIAGIRSSKATCRIWRHNDVSHLRSLLENAPRDGSKLIALESVYSMDGDVGPVREVCDLAEEFGAFVFLDEVHAVGLYGSSGAGIAAKNRQGARIDVLQGTLGKAFGVQGGYIAGSKVIIDFVRSFAPGFIFSTALSPVLAAAALASVRHLVSSDYERDRQRENVCLVKSTLREKGIRFLDQPTHIIPVMIEGAERCVSVANKLMRDWNIYAQPIVYPTVRRGGERIRITPSPFHTERAIVRLGDALSEAIWESGGFAD